MFTHVRPSSRLRQICKQKDQLEKKLSTFELHIEVARFCDNIFRWNFEVCSFILIRICWFFIAWVSIFCELGFKRGPWWILHTPSRLERESSSNFKSTMCRKQCWPSDLESGAPMIITKEKTCPTTNQSSLIITGAYLPICPVFGCLWGSLMT